MGPLSMMKHLEDDVPPVFMILDTFDKDIKSLMPGTHLFCVYGDNWFQSVRYSLRCLVAVPQDTDCVETIKTTEEKLATKKKELEKFQSEFCEIKKKYDTEKEPTLTTRTPLLSSTVMSKLLPEIWPKKIKKK